ncbi:anthranilate phosphoribosyltransferase [candidate division GN15 bacterium]|uniref:Anthranilate phosphoribosyltransferase n=1 Tax=candidate division GN15 bacterium TaxID=2072418 RepID=A0A855X4P1_9BACT|nr:MAG: anthranilate phosphoribosyltransferase [candidate division GN15 bacterium]
MSDRVLAKLTDGNDLSSAESEKVMAAIADGEFSPVKSAAFLTALALKGETPEEVAGCIQAFRKRAVKVPHHQETVFDCCGTGGDCSGSFNISTAAAFVVAACGIPTAKHGNRSVTSQCGSADVLEQLGVRVQLSPESAARCLDEIGICFLYAPSFHPAMKNIAPIRRELGFRTVFNLLGPLLNPAGATHQIIGTPSISVAESLSQAATCLESGKVWFLHNSCGLDELAPFGMNMILSSNGHGPGWSVLGNHSSKELDTSCLKGGPAEQNAEIIRRMFDGEQSPKRLAVELNAAAGLTLVGAATDFEAAVPIASEAIESGKARDKMNALIELTGKLT